MLLVFAWKIVFNRHGLGQDENNLLENKLSLGCVLQLCFGTADPSVLDCLHKKMP